jgi:hypothetical protein
MIAADPPKNATLALRAGRSTGTAVVRFARTPFRRTSIGIEFLSAVTASASRQFGGGFVT